MNNVTNKLRLPFIMASQAQKHVTHNEGLQILDTVTQLALQSVTLATPPANPLGGGCWYVPELATGLWASHNGELAKWQDGAWIFMKLSRGWRAWVEDEAQIKVWDATQWAPIAPDAQPATKLGINGTADDINRLSLNSPASLFNHEGAGHQLKINKESVLDTGTILYQTSFSGRAELGLAREDNFSIKVTSDGSEWRTALSIDAQTGTVKLPHTKTPLAIVMENTNRLDPVLSMTGTSRDNSEDIEDGVGLYLTHNGPNNRQFVLADTKTVKGVRFLGHAIDGYSDGARADLRLGSNTNGVHIGAIINNTQCSISNHSGLSSKVVTSIAGHENQTGDLLHISTQHIGPQGDALKIRADKVSEFGGPLRLSNHSLASLPPPSEPGSLIYVNDESAGPVLAFSDGENWRRATDRRILT